MLTERQRALIQPLNGDQINELIFKHHNYDGLAAQRDLHLVAQAERFRATMRRSTPVWMGMAAVGGYNLTRMGVLSNTGRIGAIGGLAVGTFMTVFALRA